MIETEVLIAGAGPAGIAAATSAARCGRDVTLLDDNPLPGGQIWRAGFHQGKGESKAENVRRCIALSDLARSGAKVLPRHQIFQAEGTKRIEALHEQHGSSSVVSFRCQHLVIATGARERFLPFPGWTLPGVYGAGGLQALVRGGISVAGKRVVVAGSGPLLLAVAAHLRASGAEVRCIAEQASRAQLIPFAASLWSHPAKIVQGLRYRASLRRTRYRLGCWPVAAIASPDDAMQLSAVRLTDGRRTWEEPCDLLACGFHLVPNTELAALLKCGFDGDYVRVDREQRTSVADVFCVGEPTGVAGVDAARMQGEIAGLACAERSNARLGRRSGAERAFGRRLNAAFALRAELRSVPQDDTIVCRCEDVPFGRVRVRTGWTDAKLQTRCGMGPCQGRICGPALQVLLGWQPTSIRPPLFPVPIEALCPTDFKQQESETLV